MVQQQFAGQIEIIGVGGSSSSIDELDRFAKTYGADLTHVADIDNSVWERYGVTSQLVYAFINDDGTAEVTRLPLAELAGRIEELLAA